MLAVALLFLIYIVSSIYGTLNLKHGLDTYNLVSKDSYYYKYGIWDKTYFTSDPLLSVFIKDSHQYHSPNFQSNIRSLILSVMKDKNIDDNFEINWLEAYKISPFYFNTSENDFTIGLVNFLQSPQGLMYSNDIVLNKTNLKILSSKVHLKTFDLKTSEEKGDFMIRIRHIEKQAPFPCIIFSPMFILCEQYIQIMPTTLQTVGISGNSVNQIFVHANFTCSFCSGTDATEYYCGNFWIHVLLGPFSQFHDDDSSRDECRVFG